MLLEIALLREALLRITLLLREALLGITLLLREALLGIALLLRKTLPGIALLGIALLREALLGITLLREALLGIALLLREALLRITLLRKTLSGIAHAHSLLLEAHILLTESASGESRNYLVSLLLIAAELVGIAVVGAVIRKLKLDIGEVGRIDGEIHGDLVAVVVARGIVGYALALAVLSVDLGAVLLNLIAGVGYLRKIDQVGVLGAVVALPADDKFSLCVVDIYLRSAAVNAVGAEAVEVLPVLLPVSELLLDVLDSRFFSAREEGRKLAGALAADVAVLYLAVAEQTDLFAADIAVFFVKKSHFYSPFI